MTTENEDRQKDIESRLEKPGSLFTSEDLYYLLGRINSIKLERDSNRSLLKKIEMENEKLRGQLKAANEWLDGFHRLGKVHLKLNEIEEMTEQNGDKQWVME